MIANYTLKHHNPTPQGADSESSSTGYSGEEIVGTAEQKKIIISGFDLTGFGPSAEPDHSGLTIMGRFLADEGIGRMERLICSTVPVQPLATVKKTGESSGNRKKASSVVVEVGSVCSLEANRIARDFGGK